MNKRTREDKSTISQVNKKRRLLGEIIFVSSLSEDEGDIDVETNTSTCSLDELEESLFPIMFEICGDFKLDQFELYEPAPSSRPKIKTSRHFPKKQPNFIFSCVINYEYMTFGWFESIVSHLTF